MPNRKITATAVALQSLAIAPYALAGAPAAQPAQPEAQEINELSLSSIESSWLELPEHCKARFFNADAVKARIHILEDHIEELYAELEEAGER